VSHKTAQYNSTTEQQREFQMSEDVIKTHNKHMTYLMVKREKFKVKAVKTR